MKPTRHFLLSVLLTFCSSSVLAAPVPKNELMGFPMGRCFIFNDSIKAMNYSALVANSDRKDVPMPQDSFELFFRVFGFIDSENPEEPQMSENGLVDYSFRQYPIGKLEFLVGAKIIEINEGEDSRSNYRVIINKLFPTSSESGFNVRLNTIEPQKVGLDDDNPFSAICLSSKYFMHNEWI